ncbi:MAG TPA: complex I NDUFA9 subunit family protein [Acidiferrobacteraceae bacterium]|nr:complex I NDUFA9 subunit family protein [Acidiferrobacteraceae bacterium]HEX20554.1 complex I NDUFA9 subunit family protein [Acidiferrobacteraceae bacterium]
MPGLNVCLLGGCGFVGHSIAARLSTAGHYSRIITRRRERHRDLLVLPNCHIVQGDVHDPAFLQNTFKDMDVVINLVGILNEKGRNGKGFEKVHVHLTQKIIEACRNSGANRLLHMSALHASVNGPSHYLRSKGYGENLVHDAARHGLRVTSFRPSVMFGPMDSFLNRFAQLLSLAPGWFPLACAGSRMQPVYVEDVARAFVTAISDRKTYGQRYELCGPRAYTLMDIVRYVDQLQQGRHRIIPLGDGLSKLQAVLLEFFPGKPFTMDNYRSLQIDSVCRGAFPEIFGIVPTAMEEIMPGAIGVSTQAMDEYRQDAKRNKAGGA